MKSSVTKIVSGGQTGADRGGLDAAIALGIAHGGWCPARRRAEDGKVPAKYALRETLARDYSVRTQLNVRDSDGTIVVTRGAATGGSALTIDHARTIGRPVMHLDLQLVAADDAALRLRAWCVAANIRVLNVAGSRESHAAGLAAAVQQIVMRALASP